MDVLKRTTGQSFVVAIPAHGNTVNIGAENDGTACAQSRAANNNGEMWVKNMYVALYMEGSYNNHVERRERKLLLNKKEIRNLQDDTKAPGFTIVPVRLFINEKGLAKLVIALARGKKEYDKRQTLKEKEDRREMDRAKKVRL